MFNSTAGLPSGGFFCVVVVFSVTSLIFLTVSFCYCSAVNVYCPGTIDIVCLASVFGAVVIVAGVFLLMDVKDVEV